MSIFPDKISKIGWYLKKIELPVRSFPAGFNFCIHTETLHDDDTYNSVRKFAKEFNAYTGKKIAVCIMTPACPLIRSSMEKAGVSDGEFRSRVAAISEFAEIGYHGHFYLTGGSALTQVSHMNYDKEAIRAQIDEEMAWFKVSGIFPTVYIAGWWFLTADIVAKLENCGFLIDVSIRRGKTDTAGGKYLEDAVIPEYGRPFILPPSKNIVEIQSVFGPVMPPPIMRGHLSPYLKEDVDRQLSFIFPLHDWDIAKYYRNIWSNVRELEGCKKTIEWMDLNEMRDRFLR